MNKATKYAINGAICAGAINAIVNLVKQLENTKLGYQQKFAWGRFIAAAAKGAAIGGGTGFIVGSVRDHFNSKKIPINTEIYLYSLINQIKLKKEDTTYAELRGIADAIIALLQSEYKDQLAFTPSRIGSTEKGTALKDTFDIDISVMFKPWSFQSTREMYYDIGAYFESLIGRHSIVAVREQKKSIGVLVLLKNIEHKIDIVPCKLTQRKGNRTAGYLHVNNRSLLWNKASYTKTDLHLIAQLRLTPVQQRIVLLLKKWRDKTNLPLSSHLIENLVLCANEANSGALPRTLSEKVVTVMRYIADNLADISIISAENTNNILTYIPQTEKYEIIAACNRAIEEYEYQPNSIIEIFG